MSFNKMRYSVRGLERSELGGSHGCQGAFGADFYNRSTRTIVGTMLWTDYRPVIKNGPKGALAAMRSAQFNPLQASDRV